MEDSLRYNPDVAQTKMISKKINASTDSLKLGRKS